jgi:Tfp pilus assembly protein FimV
MASFDWVGTPDDKLRPAFDPCPVGERDENGNRPPSRSERLAAERKRKAEREARKADRRAGVKRAPNQFETVLGNVIGFVLMIGLLVLIGLVFRAAFPGHP